VDGERLPSFDLVVATVGRVSELERLLASLEAQTHRDFRVILVDQNRDDRLEAVRQRHRALDLVDLRSQPGLSRARNAALAHVDRDVVAFPDDDCVFPPDLLERVVHRFAERPELLGVTGRAADQQGKSSSSWSTDASRLTRENVWNRAISFTIFLRRSVVESVGGFDEALGLGSMQPWSSGEEIDYLVRALDSGAEIDFDPSIVVVHDQRSFSPETLRSTGARDGASVGYILRKHRYPLRTVGRMLIRPAGGALLATAHRDGTRARFHVATLRGRLHGYRESTSAKTSA
jgi:GT2 family glycosyltransferase